MNGFIVGMICGLLSQGLAVYFDLMPQKAALLGVVIGYLGGSTLTFITMRKNK